MTTKLMPKYTCDTNIPCGDHRHANLVSIRIKKFLEIVRTCKKYIGQKLNDKFVQNKNKDKTEGTMYPAQDHKKLVTI